jgi:hypothetical protein
VTVGVTTNLFVYNGANDLLKMIDGKNQTNTWNQTFGGVTNKLDTAGNILFVYKYDADNRLTNRWSIAKATTVYRYDPLGKLANALKDGKLLMLQNSWLCHCLDQSAPD